MAKEYNIFVVVLAVSALTNVVTASRKYDLEAECQRVYKEGLKNVLARFRRTEGYLSILEDKQNELYTRLNHNLMQVMAHYSKKDIFLDRLRQQMRLQWPNATHYPDDEMNEPQLRGGSSVSKKPKRTKGERNNDLIDKLDNYPALHSHLKVSQRNSAKDLGYELTGQIIHAVIDSFGGESGPLKSISSRHPYGGALETCADDTTTTTKIMKANTTRLVARQSKVSDKRPERSRPDANFELKKDVQAKSKDQDELKDKSQLKATSKGKRGDKAEKRRSVNYVAPSTDAIEGTTTTTSPVSAAVSATVP